MENKYYKIMVDDLFNVRYYGIKKDFTSPAHPENFQSLEYLYKIKYPVLMQKVAHLEYMNYRTQENNDISPSERNFYNVPYYFLVTEVQPNGYFEYKELLTGISFLIPQEVYAKSFGYPLNLRKEITYEELVKLYNADYINRICSLFGLSLTKDEIEEKKRKLVKNN